MGRNEKRVDCPVWSTIQHQVFQGTDVLFCLSRDRTRICKLFLWPDQSQGVTQLIFNFYQNWGKWKSQYFLKHDKKCSTFSFDRTVKIQCPANSVSLLLQATVNLIKLKNSRGYLIIKRLTRDNKEVDTSFVLYFRVH